MAFAMTAGNRTESIGHSEELIFSFAARAPNTYPRLSQLEQQYYESPTIDPATATELATELRLLENGPARGHRPLRAIVTRLAEFFENAAASSEEIVCVSD
jgi:hypothetical protein